MRDQLHVHLDGLEVSVSAFDMASLQQVMFYHRYERHELLQGSVFENTLSESTRKAGGLEADHSKLDKVIEEALPGMKRILVEDSFKKRHDCMEWRLGWGGLRWPGLGFPARPGVG